MKLVFFILSLFLAVGCIPNDIPYPAIVPEVLSVKADGASSVNIDSHARCVKITLDESADIQAVNITEAKLSDGVTLSDPIVGVHDMTVPFSRTLYTNGEYMWTFKAVQEIEMYFTVDGQIGTSEIDPYSHRVVAKVSPNVQLSSVNVTSLKLGPAGITTYSPAISELKDFSEPVELLVTAFERTVPWHIFIEKKEVLAEVESVSPWSKVAWFYGSGIADELHGFRYRESGSDEWRQIKASSQESSFMAMADDLLPDTKYECKAFSGDNESEVVEFTTEGIEQIPNAGFEVFSHMESDNYYSYYDQMLAKWWDSGNAGSTTVGAAYSICTPDTRDFVEGAASARLNSRNVIIKFAAGNVFCGEFAGVIGTKGGKVHFGRPFDLRPRQLKLWVKYNCGVVDCIGSYPQDKPVYEGDNDYCSIFVALGDWDYKKFGGTPESPVLVNTTDKSTFFDPNSSAVIAYGNWTVNSSTDGWIPVTIPLVYNSVTRKPTHIIISCAASALGDYFTGSSSSTLWVDDMVLEY